MTCYCPEIDMWASIMVQFGPSVSPFSDLKSGAAERQTGSVGGMHLRLQSGRRHAQLPCFSSGADSRETVSDAPARR